MGIRRTVTLPSGSDFAIDRETGQEVPAPITGGYTASPLMDGFGPTGQIHRRAVRPDSDKGIIMETNLDTGIPYWPPYASGQDDILMRALVGGYVVGGGMTPMVDSMLSTIVSKRQGMVQAWQIMVNGRKSPVDRVIDIFERANDGMGAADFVADFIGALDVDNKGAFISTVPFHLIPTERWHEYGMRLIPIESRRGRGRQHVTHYMLDMDTNQFRENYGLYSVDGLRCHPTGNPGRPYWFRTQRDNQWIWVLISHPFGAQRTQHAGPKASQYPGWGQSGSWRYSPYVIKGIALDRTDWEAIVNRPPSGIVAATGLDYAGQFREQLESFQEEMDDEQVLLYPGVLFTETTSDTAKIVVHPWSEPPEGYTSDQWENERISNLAACFHMNETHLRLRLGEGALSQSEVANEMEADTSMAWIRMRIEEILNHVAANRRVLVTVTSRSDKQRRFQAETISTLTGALQDASLAAGGPVVTVEQMKELLRREGLEIPEETDEDGGNIEPTIDYRRGLQTLASISENPDPKSRIASARNLWEQYGASNIVLAAWDPELFAWTDDEDGIQYSDSQMAGVRDSFVESVEFDVSAIQDDATDDEIINAANDAIDTIIDTTVALFSVAVGGFDEMNASKWDLLKGRTDDIADALRLKIQQLIAGTITSGAVRRFMRLMLNSAVSGYEIGRASLFGVSLPQYPGDGQTECNGNCKCFLSFSLQDGRVAVHWNLVEEAENCPDCELQAEQWAPLLI